MAEIQSESEETRKQLEEQRAKCEALEKRESERQQLEEKKHNEEIQFLKATNQQLKVKDDVQHTLTLLITLLSILTFWHSCHYSGPAGRDLHFEEITVVFLLLFFFYYNKFYTCQSVVQ